MWELDGSRCIKVLEAKGKKAEFLRVCWAPPGTEQVMLATGSADGTVRLWGSPRNSKVTIGDGDGLSSQLSSLKVLGKLQHRDRAKGLDGQIYSCQFVRDDGDIGQDDGRAAGGSLALLTASDCSIHLWDVETQERRVSRALLKVGSHSIGGERNPEDLPFVFDAKPRPGSGSYPIAVALSDGTVRVGDILRNPDQPHVLKPDGGQTHLTALAWAEDGTVLVSCAGDGSMTVWDARTWTSRAVLRGHGKPVYGATFYPCAAISASGNESQKLLLSWSSDETICMWDVTRASLTGTKPLSTLFAGPRFPIFHCALSVNGGLLAVAGGDSASSFVGVPIKIVEIHDDEATQGTG